MKYVLKENGGIPRRMLIMMAVTAGFCVSNLYYNQPLLDIIRNDLNISEASANLITVVTQIGYALGLFLIIPTGDLYSRRRIISLNMLIAAVMAAFIGFSTNTLTLWIASLVLGMCSVSPQLFMPIAGQFSAPKDKSRNIGIVLSGLLTGILVSRVISGFVGAWFGWRTVFFIAALLMLACLVACRLMIPEMKRNFNGGYSELMRSIFSIYVSHPRIRLYSFRAAFGFGSMLCIWACLAFHIARPPFRAGSNVVGLLGICGILGAVAASGMGKYIPKFGIRKFSTVGAVLQIAAWGAAYFFNDSYFGLIAAIILSDLGLQCQQLSNQSGCIQEIPEAGNRTNTIFMTTYFIGGSFGTFCAGYGWQHAGWTGVCLAGTLFALLSLTLSLLETKILRPGDCGRTILTRHHLQGTEQGH